jgi:hypothetical protein
MNSQPVSRIEVTFGRRKHIWTKNYMTVKEAEIFFPNNSGKIIDITDGTVIHIRDENIDLLEGHCYEVL